MPPGLQLTREVGVGAGDLQIVAHLAAALAVGIIFYSAAGAIRNVLTRTLLALPHTGGWLRRRETLKICQSLGLMLGSGATLPQSLAAAHEAVGLASHKALLDRAEARIVAGEPLAAALDDGKLVDETTLAMIAAGEETDALVPILDACASMLAEETSRSLGLAIRTLTPILTLVIASCVGAIILTTISAIMDLNDVAF